MENVQHFPLVALPASLFLSLILILFLPVLLARIQHDRESLGEFEYSKSRIDRWFSFFFRFVEALKCFRTAARENGRISARRIARLLALSIRAPREHRLLDDLPKRKREQNEMLSLAGHLITRFSMDRRDTYSRDYRARPHE